jgi:hypothetical protein
MQEGIQGRAPKPVFCLRPVNPNHGKPYFGFGSFHNKRLFGRHHSSESRNGKVEKLDTEV